LRVTKDACDICGGHDQYRKRRIVKDKPVITTVNMLNFEHDERFLVGTKAETALQEPLGGDS
jgi:hypothetical protein